MSLGGSLVSDVCYVMTVLCTELYTLQPNDIKKAILRNINYTADRSLFNVCRFVLPATCSHVLLSGTFFDQVLMNFEHTLFVLIGCNFGECRKIFISVRSVSFHLSWTGIR